jgi:membrane protein
MPSYLSTGYRLLRETASSWSEDNAARLAAALAFYTVLSSAPLLVVAVAVAGVVFGEDAARGQIAAELGRVVGPAAGQGIETLLAQAHAPDEGVIGTLVGLVVLLFGASGVFGELQDALNSIWNVEPKQGGGVWGYMRERFFSFSMVMAVAFLLLVMLVISAAISAAGKYFVNVLPGGMWLWQVANFVLSWLVVAVLFGLIFKVIPDTKIVWHEVWPGALATSLLFSLGKFVLGWYLGRASVASPYGAAGSVVVLVIWVYYAAQIFFFGAEFTHVYAEHRRQPKRRDEDARKGGVTSAAPA